MNAWSLYSCKKMFVNSFDVSLELLKTAVYGLPRLQTSTRHKY